MKIIETTMLVFNSEKYEKDIKLNEVIGTDLPIEKEFIEVPFTFLMKDVSSFSPDYSGDDTIDLPKSKHFVSRTFIFFSNGDSKSISMSYDTFKGMFNDYHSSKDKVSFEKEIDINISEFVPNEPKSQREIDYDNLLAKTKESDLSYVGAKIIDKVVMRTNEKDYYIAEKGENTHYSPLQRWTISYSEIENISRRNKDRGILTTFVNPFVNND